MLKTEEDIAGYVAAAQSPLRITGGGTRPIGRSFDGETLSVANLSGVTMYEPGALTLVAKAGTSVAEIETILAAENQRLAFEPMDHRTLLGTKGVPTIGGVVAANVSGPRRIAVGACRDFLLGVRYVNGSGAVVKNGGRVMKNVTGYDLVKLMAGSYGTLGVLTEVSMKVLPTVETAATLKFAGLDVARSVAAMSSALGSPFEVTGAARIDGDTVLRIEGFEGSVAYRANALRDHLKAHGPATLINDQAAHQSLWQNVKDVTRLAPHSCVWRVSLRPSQAAGFIERIQRSHSVETTLDWGGGLIWVGSADTDAAAQLHRDLQTAATQLSGHATLVKAPVALRQAVPSFQPEAAPLAALTQGLRARFDPKSIFNPGLMS